MIVTERTTSGDCVAINIAMVLVVTTMLSDEESTREDYFNCGDELKNRVGIPKTVQPAHRRVAEFKVRSAWRGCIRATLHDHNS